MVLGSDEEIELVSVIVLTRNRQDKLRDCLHSIQVQNFPAVEIVVVDNGSTDGTTSMIREDFSTVEYVQLEENRGGAARNLGVDRAEGGVVLLLDDDTRLPRENVISRIAEKFRENSDLGAAGFRLIDEAGEEEEWFKWKEVGSERSGFLSPTFPDCAAAIRPEMFERTGGFWEPYFIHLEARDFATRILNSGAEVRYFPLISVVHRSQGRRRETGRGFYYLTRNKIWYFWRNFGIFRAFGRTLKFLFKRAMQALLKRRRLLYYSQAIVDAARGLNRAFSTRDPVQKKYLPLADGNFSSPSKEPEGQ